MKKIAVIFDMDGVVSDTQRFHAEVESMLLQRFDVAITPNEVTARYAGRATEEWLPELLAEHGKTVESIDDLLFEKWDLMAKVAKGNIREIEGAGALIRALKQDGYKLAIASSSTKMFIAEILGELQLTDYFDATVSAQEVAHGKPAPDIFLLAATRLGVTPDQSVVIEDGRSGMVAATAAGMASVGLVGDVIGDWPATKLITSLKDITPENIAAL